MIVITHNKFGKLHIFSVGGDRFLSSCQCLVETLVAVILGRSVNRRYLTFAPSLRNCSSAHAQWSDRKFATNARAYGRALPETHVSVSQCACVISTAVTVHTASTIVKPIISAAAW